MKKIIVITSGKGGVGKTTTAVNLGAAMNHFGKDVLVIDGNLTTPNIGLHLNSPEVPITLNNVLSGKADAFQAMYEHESGLKIIQSSLSIKDLTKIKPERMKDFREDFKKMADYVLVDSSAGLGNEALSAIRMADELILVTNPEMPALTDALKTIKMAEQMRKSILGAVVTRVRKDDIETQPETVREMLEIPVLGMIPEDVNVQRAISMRNAVVHTHPKSNASRAYKEIAAKLLNIEYDSDKDKEKFFEKLFGKMKKKKRK
jgi:septum site-determining protein MinD